jgi:hypothetical protein
MRAASTALGAFGLIIIVLGGAPADSFGRRPCHHNDERANLLQNQIDDILSASTPTDIAYRRRGKASFRTLFELSGTDGLRELQQSSFDTIAIQAAWESVRLALKQSDKRDDDDQRGQKVAWFLGFVEGRTRTTLPAWWQTAMLGAKHVGNESIAPSLPKKDLYHLAGVRNYRSPIDTTLSTDGSDVRVVIRGKALNVPLVLLSRNGLGDKTCVSGLICTSKCYLAIHDEFGSPFKLLCFEYPSTKLVWVAEIWGMWWYGASGPHFAIVGIEEQGQNIAVFGLGTTGAMIEVVREKDGKSVYRFATNY